MDAASDTSNTRQRRKAADDKPKSRRPANNAFRQQRLKAWQPIITPKAVIPIFFSFGAFFAVMGALILWASSLVQELVIDYTGCGQLTLGADAVQLPSSNINAHFSLFPSNTSQLGDTTPTWQLVADTMPIGNPNLNRTIDVQRCDLEFYLPQDIGPPVYLYYQLTQFYQNHRRYVKSFDANQLLGKGPGYSTIQGGDCSPLDVSDGKIIYPCGLVANSNFNDTFYSPVLLNAPGTNANNVTYEMADTGIAWSSDAALYGSTSGYSLDEITPPPNWARQYPEGYNSDFPPKNLNADESFQNWMRTAALPTFSKLALRNDTKSMQSGQYAMSIIDNFNTTLYGGEKSIIISTRTVMGGRNPNLGFAMVVFGGLCLVIGVGLVAMNLIKPRKLGDHKYLSWNTDK